MFLEKGGKFARRRHIKTTVHDTSARPRVRFVHIDGRPIATRPHRAAPGANVLQLAFFFDACRLRKSKQAPDYCRKPADGNSTPSRRRIGKLANTNCRDSMRPTTGLTK